MFGVLKICFFILLITCTSAQAARVVVDAVPTAWKVESYGEKAVVLWFTPSTCASGQLVLPLTATAIEHNRLYGTVMAAKISGKKIFVMYERVDDACVLLSYGLSEQ